jgi:rare lipoprotein A (peptidoglycan hydrolase)
MWDMGYAIDKRVLNPKSHISHLTWQSSSRVNPFRILLLAFPFLLVACASTTPETKKGDYYTVAGKRYYPISSSAGFAQRGLASWYGGKFHGRGCSQWLAWFGQSVTVSNRLFFR